MYNTNSDNPSINKLLKMDLNSTELIDIEAIAHQEFNIIDTNPVFVNYDLDATKANVNEDNYCSVINFLFTD